MDNSFRYYIKGAPEKIKELCNKNSLPFDFNIKLKQSTEEGFRVLACATKPLSENFILDVFKEKNRNKNDTQYLRTRFENDLIFLGFIKVSNKIKRDTTAVMQGLINCGMKLVISTGDSPFTTVSIAKECRLIENNKIIILLDSIDDKIDM